MTSTIGILGGMGPLATLDFVQKIIHHTHASSDQENIPLQIHCVPQIPDRTAFLMGAGESPLPALAKGLNTLIGTDVGCITIPCNTAHYWHPDLQRISSVPILHIAQTCAQQLTRQHIKSVALMATDGTLKAGFYSKELAQYGIELTQPSTEIQEKIMNGIYLVKAGSIEQGASTLEECVKELLLTGVESVILGCTEIPFALDHIHSETKPFTLDATDTLAKACVEWYAAEQLKTL
ncbi:aspartate/glutamate racemase family protein [Marinomonas pollencensis]|uniref:Aspartate racemase n=1 Tax=Marinomonas pollencensis TaxID=491954 RepID=A0A3E0DQ51_9GAMM|nr:amino acid racemase [Marinomonas pollencensis]REG85050.1 aspartate racemase [Marinomonas pollencensis]